MTQIVIDTNVLVAGLYSSRGYAHELLQLVGTGRFDINLSVPLLLEYESVLFRLLPELPVSKSVIQDVIDYHCAVARHHTIFYLWRPFLRDPKDEMILELAVKAGCDYIVTFNTRDFHGVEAFGMEAIEPGTFLKKLEEKR